MSRSRQIRSPNKISGRGGTYEQEDGIFWQNGDMFAIVATAISERVIPVYKRGDNLGSKAYVMAVAYPLNAPVGVRHCSRRVGSS